MFSSYTCSAIFFLYSFSVNSNKDVEFWIENYMWLICAFFCLLCALDKYLILICLWDHLVNLLLCYYTHPMRLHFRSCIFQAFFFFFTDSNPLMKFHTLSSPLFIFSFHFFNILIVVSKSWLLTIVHFSCICLYCLFHLVIGHIFLLLFILICYCSQILYIEQVSKICMMLFLFCFC